MGRRRKAVLLKFLCLFFSWYDRAYSVPALTNISYMIKSRVHVKQAVMPKYCRMCKFSTLIHLTTLFYLHNHLTNNYSILMLLRESEFLAHKTYMPSKTFIPGKPFQANTRFALITFTCFSCSIRNLAQYYFAVFRRCSSEPRSFFDFFIRECFWIVN